MKIHADSTSDYNALVAKQMLLVGRCRCRALGGYFGFTRGVVKYSYIIDDRVSLI